MSSPANKGSGKAVGKRMVVARRFTLAAVLVAVLASLALDSGIGTPSSFGVGEFFLLCPLGGIEAMVASKSFIPVAAISMGVVLVFCLLFGRAWCAWGCPAPVIRKFFKRDIEPGRIGGRGNAQSLEQSSLRCGTRFVSTAPPSDATESEIEALEDDGAGRLGGRGCSTRGFVAGLRHVGRDGRTWVFVAVVIAAFVAGFPIFCLVCPIGLTFGTVGSLWHLIVDKQMTLSVVAFPTALLVELVLYRKWCMNLCPVAGLLGIVGQFARLFRPRVNAATCLRYRDGVDCTVCTAACVERIDLHAADARQKLGECTRCGECAAQCPTASISIKLAPGDPVARDVGGE